MQHHAQLPPLPSCSLPCSWYTLFQGLNDRNGQAETWDSLGYAHHHLGNHTHAVTSYQHVLTPYRDLGDRYHKADTSPTSAKPNTPPATLTPPAMPGTGPEIPR